MKPAKPLMKWAPAVKYVPYNFNGGALNGGLPAGAKTSSREDRLSPPPPINVAASTGPLPAGSATLPSLVVTPDKRSA